MKLSPRDADAYFARPDAAKAGILIYGGDAMRVALKRQQILTALLGPAAEEEMRLSRMSGSDLRGDPAQVLDAVKAVGFFPGPRAVFVEEATDQALAALTGALQDWAPGDAQIVVTAGQLKPTSKLRKLFETDRRVYAAGIYDDPPSRGEIERILSQAGLQAIPGDVMNLLVDLANDLGPGDFGRTMEKLALYKMGDASPLTPEDVEAVAPRSTEAGLDSLLNVVAEGKAPAIGPLLRRLEAQGTQPVGLCIGAARHFRMLYVVASAQGGPQAGIGKLRPPVYGKRRDALLRQAEAWGASKLEKALSLLTETDLSLRSAGQTAPQMAVVERALIRLAMLLRAR